MSANTKKQPQSITTDVVGLSDLLARLVPPSRDVDYAYRMGRDCAINGANETNCHFAIFSSPENTKAWEQGKRDAEQTG